MKVKYIDVDKDKWGILLIYGFDFTDADEMAAVMEALGMKIVDVKKALRVLSTYDSGMTVSRDDLRMSAVFIGKPSCNAQFWNSVSHELTHVTTAVIDYYGEPYYGEPAAYLRGYLLQRVVEEVAEPCY